MIAVRSTIRLQFHREFPFDAATEQVPYFQRLGVSHVYASPILAARPGSRHGYDVIDHRIVSPELGGEEALRRLVARLREHGMGLIADIVPNHMAASPDNEWWMDVLEWGRDSPFAHFFDIDWNVPDPELRGRLLAPFLGQQYGEALAEGELKLDFETASGRFLVRYYDQRYPIAPREYERLLEGVGDHLPFGAPLPRRITAARAAFTDGLRELARRAQEPDGAEAVRRVLQAHDAASDLGRERLHKLLERQHYRLAWWRTAPDEINWRRFFDLTDYAALRVEEPAVFEAVHATVLRLYAEGIVDGVRIDHVDGLADPRGYCRKLRSRLAAQQSKRPPELRTPAYLVVEKILAPGERLPRDWRADGTTGYSFMNDVAALLHDPRGAEPLAQLWTRLTGRAADFSVEERRARRRIADEFLIADFNATALALHRVARAQRTTRDISLASIRRVLLELLVHFPVYRTYADAHGRAEGDDLVMQRACEGARPACRPAERYLVDVLNGWLGGEPPVRMPSKTLRSLRLRAITRFQQLSSPLAAKSVEDTAFYRHGRLLSRTEVGADPGQFAMDLDAFHAECQRRQEIYPQAMLTTATHDHKRGEDARARLAVLSEVPERWKQAVQEWMSLNEPLRARVDEAPAPAPADEYMLYQALVGHWPPELKPDDRPALQEWGERVAGWHLKAMREAKLRSSWVEPNTAYEEACRNFLMSVLDPQRSRSFLETLSGFIDSIAPAGIANSLTQTLLRLTAPGIPDLYQGADFWDYSMVDPDNRRPVDYAARASALTETSDFDALLDRWHDGRVKQRLISRALWLRSEAPELFTVAEYLPLRVHGPHAPKAVAFLRRRGERALLVVGARQCAEWIAPQTARISPEKWADTAIEMPPSLLRKPWTSLITGHRGPLTAPLTMAAALDGRTVAVWHTGIDTR